MDEIKIDNLVESSDSEEYIPEDPNIPVDDFEISEIEIEDNMPEDLKAAIRRYNEIHTRTVAELIEEENSNVFEEDDTLESTNDSGNSIVEDNVVNFDLKNIF